MKGRKNECLGRTQTYTESFKRNVCEEYLAGGVTKVFLLKKYNIRYRSAIQKWMRVYGYTDVYQNVRYLALSNSSTLASHQTSKAAESSTESLEKRIKELERMLEDEQLRSEAYRRMIDIAEKELKLPIRKKFNTK